MKIINVIILVPMIISGCASMPDVDSYYQDNYGNSRYDHDQPNAFTSPPIEYPERYLPNYRNDDDKKTLSSFVSGVKPLTTNSWDYVEQRKSLYYNPICYKTYDSPTDIPYSVVYAHTNPDTCTVSGEIIVGHTVIKDVFDAYNCNNLDAYDKDFTGQIIAHKHIKEFAGDYKEYQQYECREPVPVDMVKPVYGEIIQNHQLFQDPERPGFFNFVSHDGAHFFPCRFYAQYNVFSSSNWIEVLIAKYLTDVQHDSFIYSGMMCRIRGNNTWKIMTVFPYTSTGMDYSLNKHSVGMLKSGNTVYENIWTGNVFFSAISPLLVTYSDGHLFDTDIISSALAEDQLPQAKRFPIHGNGMNYQQYHIDDPVNEYDVHDMRWDSRNNKDSRYDTGELWE